MNLKTTIKIFILLTIIGSVHSKNSFAKKDSLFIYRGQVLSENSDFPVAMAHVINYQRKRGVVADTSGYFEIWVRMGDTLNVSAIGFEYLEHPVLTNKDTSIEIFLKGRSYEIPEVSIAYLGSYEDFKYKVLNLKLPEIQINDQVEKLFKHVEPPPMVVEPVITSPASLIYVLFSKEAKDIKKYLKLEEKEKITEKVRERYNEYIIRNITGLDLNEARKFMEFCNFRDEYILSINDYNLYSEIILRFKAYEKAMQDSLNME